MDETISRHDLNKWLADKDDEQAYEQMRAEDEYRFDRNRVHGELEAAGERIRQLEQLNALLAEQIDRQRLVLDAVQGFVETDKSLDLYLAWDKYRREMVELAKEVE